MARDAADATSHPVEIGSCQRGDASPHAPSVRASRHCDHDGECRTWRADVRGRERSLWRAPRPPRSRRRRGLSGFPAPSDARIRASLVERTGRRDIDVLRLRAAPSSLSSDHSGTIGSCEQAIDPKTSGEECRDRSEHVRAAQKEHLSRYSPSSNSDSLGWRFRGEARASVHALPRPRSCAAIGSLAWQRGLRCPEPPRR